MWRWVPKNVSPKKLSLSNLNISQPDEKRSSLQGSTWIPAVARSCIQPWNLYTFWQISSTIEQKSKIQNGEKLKIQNGGKKTKIMDSFNFFHGWYVYILNKRMKWQLHVQINFKILFLSRPWFYKQPVRPGFPWNSIIPVVELLLNIIIFDGKVR